MNWTDLVYRTLVPFADEHRNDRGLTVSAKKYLVEAQEDFVRETGCLERQKWFYINAETEYIDLPVDFIKITRAEFKGYRLEYMDDYQYDSFHYHNTTAEYRFAKTERILIHGGRIYFVPGTSSAGWLTLWYKYHPKVLDDSATAYRKLDYDGLVTHFVRGETVTGEDSSATGVVEFDDNHMATGTLILSSVTGAFEDDEVLTGDSLSPNRSTYDVIDQNSDQVIDSNSNDIVTGAGFAYANGIDRGFSTAGDDPDIDDVYRKYLVDYARSLILEDKGLPNRAKRSMDTYYANRQKTREDFNVRMVTGPEKILEEW